MQNFARDVIVQLKFKHSRERVIVIIGWGIVDVRLGGGIAKFFAAWRRRLDALKIADVFPPARIPLVRRKIVRVNVRLPMRHRAAGKINKRDRAGERVVEKKCGLVRLELVRQNAARLQIGHLA